MSLVFCNI